MIQGGTATWHQGSMHVSACINISGNATFGSVVEVMVVFFAVMKNSVDVAQATLLGSMLPPALLQ